MIRKMSCDKKDSDAIKEFIQSFCKEEKDGQITCVYGVQLIKLSERKQTHIIVELDHVSEFNDGLAKSILANSSRYLTMFADMFFDLLSTYKKHEVCNEAALEAYIEPNLKKRQNDQPKSFSAQIIKRFEISLKAHSAEWAQSFNEINQEHFGKMVAIQGIITRCGELQPVEVIGTYTCNVCSAQTYQPSKSFSLIPIQNCLSNFCRTNKTAGHMHMKFHNPELIKLHELIIVEHKDAVSVGQVPRTMAIWCCDYAAEEIQLGDHIVVGGLFLPVSNSKLLSGISCKIIPSFISVKLKNQIDATV